MEYALIHNDFSTYDIKPTDLLLEYEKRVKVDIQNLFNRNEFIEAGCPTNGEKVISSSFTKYGLNYNISKEYNNIYLSPRPNDLQLAEYYLYSKSRKFWLNEFWDKTEQLRKNKLIIPRLEWVKTFAYQYLNVEKLSVAEYQPHQWGYIEFFNEVLEHAYYYLIDPRFNLDWCEYKISEENILKENNNKKFDIICLFEALDRSINPELTMKWVNNHLKKGGLCFITCILSSGFELLTLRENSYAIIPPERLNIFSFEGMQAFLEKGENFDMLEFSTPGSFDINNVIQAFHNLELNPPDFISYLINKRNDPELFNSFQDFLQLNKLSSIGRIVLRKK